MPDLIGHLICHFERSREIYLQLSEKAVSLQQVILRIHCTLGLEGAARFILGLAADIKILKGKKLLDYIKKYDKKYIQKLLTN